VSEEEVIFDEDWDKASEKSKQDFVRDDGRLMPEHPEYSQLVIYDSENGGVQ